MKLPLLRKHFQGTCIHFSVKTVLQRSDRTAKSAVLFSPESSAQKIKHCTSS